MHLKNRLPEVELLGLRIYMILIMIYYRFPSKDAVSIYNPPNVPVFLHPHISTGNCCFINRLTACSADNMEDLDGEEAEKRN